MNLGEIGFLEMGRFSVDLACQTVASFDALQSTWKILDRGDVPEQGVNVVLFDCCGCGREAELPVLGTPIAQLEGGIVFDIGKHAIPKIIQCRRCRRRFEFGD